jgi:hypothetical protein
MGGSAVLPRTPENSLSLSLLSGIHTTLSSPAPLDTCALTAVHAATSLDARVARGCSARCLALLHSKYAPAFTTPQSPAPPSAVGPGLQVEFDARETKALTLSACGLSANAPAPVASPRASQAEGHRLAPPSASGEWAWALEARYSDSDAEHEAGSNECMRSADAFAAKACVETVSRSTFLPFSAALSAPSAQPTVDLSAGRGSAGRGITRGTAGGLAREDNTFAHERGGADPAAAPAPAHPLSFGRGRGRGRVFASEDD